MTEIGWGSMEDLETSGTYFDPPVYPIKILMALGVFLLLIQGLGKLIKDICFAVDGLKIESENQEKPSEKDSN